MCTYVCMYLWATGANRGLRHKFQGHPTVTCRRKHLSGDGRWVSVFSFLFVFHWHATLSTNRMEINPHHLQWKGYEGFGRLEVVRRNQVVSSGNWTHPVSRAKYNLASFRYSYYPLLGKQEHFCWTILQFCSYFSYLLTDQKAFSNYFGGKTYSESRHSVRRGLWQVFQFKTSDRTIV